jgi:hypothetical protein
MSKDSSHQTKIKKQTKPKQHKNTKKNKKKKKTVKSDPKGFRALFNTVR